MQKIFIVEDDESIRELAIYALNSAGFSAIGFENSDSFFKELKTNLPDLILLDIMLPDQDGIAILSILKTTKNYKKLPVIMLTAKSNEYDKIKGLDIGADDYITKPFSILELIARIKAVLRRYNTSDTQVNPLTYKQISLDNVTYTVKIADNIVNLTLKEFELLETLLINQGLVLSREKIITQIWGYEFEGESRTIDMHIKSLRQKLGQCGSYIQTVRGVGYKLGES